MLRHSLDGTSAEIAAWIFSEELSAYLNANELDPPPRFRFHFHEPFYEQYEPLLAACWFYRPEIEAFQPDTRWLTGAQLRERWATLGDEVHLDAFVRARIGESMLVPAHPVLGIVDWPGSYADIALFELSHVEEVERVHEVKPLESRPSATPTPDVYDCVIQEPSRKDAWFLVMRHAAHNFQKRHSKLPNWRELWAEIVAEEGPVSKHYEVKLGVDRGGEKALKLGGETLGQK